MTRTFGSPRPARSGAGTRLIVAAVVSALALAGCSSTPAREDRPTIVPATPAVSPEPATPPAGQVLPAGAGEGLAFDPVGRRLAAISGSEIVLYTVDGGLREIGKVATKSRANQVVANTGGGFLVASKDTVTTIERDSMETKTADVDGDVLTVAPYNGDNSTALAGTSDGRVVVLPSAGERREISGPVEVSRLVTRNGEVAVVDRRQASLTEVDVKGRKMGKSLRVGRGITNAVIDPFGRILTVDTGEDQVFGYTVDPFMLRFQYPVPGSPWAVAYDETAKLMWVTQTATNEIVGYALGSGMPEVKQRFATVRQPNAIAIDDKTGTLYVQSATGSGIQAIPTR